MNSLAACQDNEYIHGSIRSGRYIEKFAHAIRTLTFPARAARTKMSLLGAASITCQSFLLLWCVHQLRVWAPPLLYRLLTEWQGWFVMYVKHTSWFGLAYTLWMRLPGGGTLVDTTGGVAVGASTWVSLGEEVLSEGRISSRSICRSGHRIIDARGYSSCGSSGECRYE